MYQEAIDKIRKDHKIRGCLSKVLTVRPHNTEKEFADIKAIYNYTEVKYGNELYEKG